MVDFLKANPYMTVEDYMWRYSIPMLKLMGMDNSHANYLSEKEAMNRRGRRMNINDMSVKELNNDLGVKIKFPNE